MYSPRIYTYKITFEETPYYYYGVHKEKVFGEQYWGSPKTNKKYWKLYTPKKQILELFDYTDDGWLGAQEVEKRLIKPFYNSDKWCLNESVGGFSSILICSQNGLKSKENKVGIFSLTKEQLIENGKKRGKDNFDNKIGFFAMTKEERSEIGKKSGTNNYQQGIGLSSISKERRSEIGKKASEKNKLNKVGIFSLTKEQMSENGRKNSIKNKENKVGIFGISLEKRVEICGKVNNQKWECLETGHITTPGPLTIYQKAKGIDTSKRIRIE